MIDEVRIYTLDDIYNLENDEIKRELLQIRTSLIDNLECDRISRKIIKENKELSVNDIETLLENAYINSTSQLYFPNDLCYFYPKIMEKRSKTIRFCDVSGAIINKNSPYYVYRPMIDNITRGKTYVLKCSIQTEIGYYDFFPQTLYEFEDLSMKLENPYELEDDDYNYYDLSKKLGSCLSLLELKKKKVKVRK